MNWRKVVYPSFKQQNSFVIIFFMIEDYPQFLHAITETVDVI